MPDDTTILSLPLILPAQAQKHVTHNEALVQLDLIVQLAVINRTLTSAPALAVVGDRHIVAAGATGVWAGQSGRIALMSETGWQFTQPLPGWRAHVLSEGQTAVFDGLAWETLADGPLSVARLGVSATPDTTNRLSVSSPATLLNHAGGGHQLKLNKAAAGNTASLLFQTGFSGRAEMGTAGSDDFSVKVSADGSGFAIALTAEAATGEVTLPQPVHLGGQAADPAVPADGTLWLNTTTGEVKVRSGGATVPVGGGGVSDGDKGDITVSGAGAVWTIDAGVVGLGKLAAIATDSFLGRDTAGSGNPEVLTPAQARGILNVADGASANASDAALRDRATHTGTQVASTISNFGSSTIATALTAFAAAGSRTAIVAADTILGGFGKVQKYLNDLSPLAFSGDASDLGGTKTSTFISDFSSAVAATAAVTANTAKVTNATHTGDVTGAAALTIAANAVDNAKLADMAANSVKARAASTSGDPADVALAASQLLGRGATGDVAPITLGTNLSMTGTTLNAAGGGGGGAPGGVSGEVQFNNAGAFAGAADVEIEDGQLRLQAIANPAVPAAGGVKLFGRAVSGRVLPAFVGPSGLDSLLAPHLGRNKIGVFIPPGNGGAVTNFGTVTAATGTSSNRNVATTNLHSYMRRQAWAATAAATAVCGFRFNALQWTLGGPSAQLGGFHMVLRWGPDTGVTTATHRAFAGMRGSIAAPTDVNPSTLTNIFGMGYDTADTNIQFMHNDASGTATKIDLGAGFPRPTLDATSVYEIALFAPPGTTQSLSYEVTNLVSGAVATGTVTTDIPGITTLLAPWSMMSVGGTSSVISISIMSCYIESDY